MKHSLYKERNYSRNMIIYTMCFCDCFAIILMIFTVKDWRGGCVRRTDGWMKGLRWRMGSRMDGGTDAEKLERLPWGRKGINHDWWQFLTDDILSPPSQNFWVWERRRGGSIRVEGWGISPGDKEGPQRTWISFFLPPFLSPPFNAPLCLFQFISALRSEL